MLLINNISGGYGSRQIINELSFSVSKGKIVGILGPNGSGKTTLLNLLTKQLPIQSGQVILDGKDIDQYSTKELAKKIAVVPQYVGVTFSYKVKEIVELGRYAYQRGLFSTLSKEDKQAIQLAMEQTGIEQLKEEEFFHLSGGQKQRVLLAQSLAQQSEILFLDEPTNHLDLSYQKSFLDLLQLLTVTKQLAVIAILHDINLAALYCDKILLMDEQGNYLFDEANIVLNVQRLATVYQTELVEMMHPNEKNKQFLLDKK